MIREYQKKAIEEVTEELKSNSRVCLAASCGSGKTSMSIKYVDNLIWKFNNVNFEDKEK